MGTDRCIPAVPGAPKWVSAETHTALSDTQSQAVRRAHCGSYGTLSLLAPMLLMGNTSPNFQQTDVRVEAERLQNVNVCCVIPIGEWLTLWAVNSSHALKEK